MIQRRGIAWLLFVALVFLVVFVGGAGMYWRLSSIIVKPPLCLKLQIDYQLESALLLAYQTVDSMGPVPLPATFTYEPPRREIMPGVMLSITSPSMTSEELKLYGLAVGSRIERHLSARIFLASFTRTDVPETVTSSLSWKIEFLPPKVDIP